MGNNPAPINQLSEPTVDGNSDENARMNCVASSIAWVLEDLAGGTFDGDQLKDTVYGQGYTGPMAASQFVAYCAAHGVTLTRYGGTQQQLIDKLHETLTTGGDALVTIPSQWGTPPADPVHPAGYTHVCAAAYSIPGGLRMMNPWGGFWHDGSDDYWRARLCYGEVWIATKQAVEVSSMWTRNPDQTATDSKGHHVGQGVADAIFTHGYESADGVTGETYYTPSESVTALGNGVILRWNGTSVDQNAAEVVTTLLQQLADAKAALTSEQGQQHNPPADQVAQAAKAAFQALKTVLAEV